MVLCMASSLAIVVSRRQAGRQMKIRILVISFKFYIQMLVSICLILDGLTVNVILKGGIIGGMCHFRGDPYFNIITVLKEFPKNIKKKRAHSTINFKMIYMQTYGYAECACIK